MANGSQTFKELKEIVAEDRAITIKSALRLIMAGLADIHSTRSADMEHLNAKLDTIREDITKIKSVTKYPSFLWYLVNMPLKTVAVLALMSLIGAFILVPEWRGWLGEKIVKALLGGL